MRKWKITSLINNVEQEFLVDKFGSDGIDMTDKEALSHILPHLRKGKPVISIISIEDITNV